MNLSMKWLADYVSVDDIAHLRQRCLYYFLKLVFVCHDLFPFICMKILYLMRIVRRFTAVYRRRQRIKYPAPAMPDHPTTALTAALFAVIQRMWSSWGKF